MRKWPYILFHINCWRQECLFFIFYRYTHPHIHINCLTIEKKPTISNIYVGVNMCEKLTKKLKWLSCRQHNNNNSETAYLFVTAIPRNRRQATSEGSECLLFTSASSRTNRDSMLFLSPLLPHRHALKEKLGD